MKDSTKNSLIRGRAGRCFAFLTFAALLGAVPAAGTVQAGENEAQQGQEEAPDIAGLTFERQLDLTYAEAVDVYYYEGGYKLFDVYDSARYLQVPDGAAVPAGLSEDIILLPDAPQQVYMAATAAMALVKAVDGLENIRFSSLTADNWYVEEAAAAMQAGDILFAGKYSEPDYELLLGGGCDLAVESTMILHSPQVQEMLEGLGIPVFIDRSSYEDHPLGRSEWAKVYGALLGKEAQAEAFFTSQTAGLEALGEIADTGKTVAFFYMNAGRTVVVRRNDDSVPKMIGMAGGQYALKDIDVLSESSLSSVNMTMEEFYANAVDADYLVYNATIDAPLYSISDLLAKSALFADFKAVQEGNVWCADKYLYQATDIIGELIMDFHTMLTGGDESEMTFLRKLY